MPKIVQFKNSKNSQNIQNLKIFIYRKFKFSAPPPLSAVCRIVDDLGALSVSRVLDNLTVGAGSIAAETVRSGTHGEVKAADQSVRTS
jgi:hypothetical protein